MNLHYVLRNKVPVACDDLLEWARQFETFERHVCDETIGDVRISTVFLGIDHSFGVGPPVLFETMIFGGKHDQYCERYSTWDEAEAGHRNAVALVRKDAQ